MEKVAPLAGSVDRNGQLHPAFGVGAVAPLAGSVDRNALEIAPGRPTARRSPRGERG